VNNWGKSVDAEIANTEVKQGIKALAHRNAYRMNLTTSSEYKAARVPGSLQGLKIYAEQPQMNPEKRLKLGIKSPSDNKIG